jgi:hypothetical protein
MTCVPAYHVRRIPRGLNPASGWNNPPWTDAQTANVAHFRPESSSHHPDTRVRLLHDARTIYGIFSVRDQFIRSVRTQYGEEVWKDSCVECFLEPLPGRGYFNLEMNAGGAHLCNFIEDPARVPGGFKKFTRLPPPIGQQIQVRSSLPKVVNPELTDRVHWELAFSVALDVFENYLPPMGELSGQVWRGNFFKCAEELSHPHWASWSPVSEFNFHMPQCFGTISFE